MTHQPLRIGVLGCAGVVDYALLAPAREEGVIAVTAIASRDAARAARHAAERGIPYSHGSYASLLQDDRIDAVYVALPNALHCEWTLRALDAGFPVLCEKPLASNAEQAGSMAARAEARGLTLFDGFHWKHHPLATRMLEIVRSGVLGTLRRIDVTFTIPAFMAPPENIRHDYALGGGTTMDTGGYCVSLMRLVTGEEPEVESATPMLVAPQVDGAMRASFVFPSGVEGSIDCTMLHAGEELSCHARISGDTGVLDVHNPFLMHLGSRLTWRGGESGDEFPTTTPSYNFQARVFVDAVRRQLPGDARDGAAIMRVIDAIYRRAGMDIRR